MPAKCSGACPREPVAAATGSPRSPDMHADVSGPSTDTGYHRPMITNSNQGRAGSPPHRRIFAADGDRCFAEPRLLRLPHKTGGLRPGRTRPSFKQINLSGTAILASNCPSARMARVRRTRLEPGHLARPGGLGHRYPARAPTRVPQFQDLSRQAPIAEHRAETASSET